MTVIALDTHAIVKELKAAGFNEAQAEAVTRVVQQAQDVDLSNLATKVDLKTDIEALRIAMKADMAEMKADILKWMFGAIGFQTLIILGAVIMLARLV